MYTEKRIDDYDKPGNERLFISLNDLVLKDKNKPPMKEVIRNKSVQELMLGYNITPVCFQIESDNTQNNETGFITSIEPDSSEPSEEYDFFG